LTEAGVGVVSGAEVSDVIADIERSVQEADEYLRRLDAAREEAVKVSRDVIRYSGFSITYLHQGDVNKASEALGECERLVRRLIESASPYPELLHSGLVYNAVSEYVEAKVFFSLMTRAKVPSFKELGVDPVPYLQGLADAVGELRRHALDSVAKENLEEAWRALAIMETIYNALKGLDYPDSVLPNVRHKVDVARALIDSTKALLVDVQSRERLMKSMGKA
jgi:translin